MPDKGGQGIQPIALLIPSDSTLPPFTATVPA